MIINYRNQAKAGTATATDVLSGKTFTSSTGVGLTGTMANKGAWTDTPTDKGKVTIPAGYHNGSGYVDTSTVYTNGYNKGVTDADARANISSANYKAGYDAGVAAGKPTKTQTISNTYTMSEGENVYPTFTFNNLTTITGITYFNATNATDFFVYDMKIASGNTVTFWLNCHEHTNRSTTITITAIGY